MSGQIVKGNEMQTSRFPQAPAAANRGLGNHPIICAAFAKYLAATGAFGFAAPSDIARELWPRDLTAQRIITKADASLQARQRIRQSLAHRFPTFSANCLCRRLCNSLLAACRYLWTGNRQSQFRTGWARLWFRHLSQKMNQFALAARRLR